MSPGEILGHARAPVGLPTLAFAGVIGQALSTGRRPLIAGIAEAQFRQLLGQYFPTLDLENGEPPADVTMAGMEEFDDLLALLLNHRAAPTKAATWLCHAIASAAMGENHLWQDMGLPNRRALSELMREYFPALAAKNSGDMKWKKFFYRQLCEQAEVLICKSPHCAECCDYSLCFGHEE